MKRYFFILAIIIGFIGCTKEGIVGAQGPEGPEGDPGAPGSGTGSGGITSIRSLLSESPARFSWVAHSNGTTSSTYILKWEVPFNEYVADNFVLGQDFSDSATSGGLLIYASEGKENGDHKWHQLPFTDAGFGNMTIYRYQIVMQASAIILQIFADRSTGFGPGTQIPSIRFNAIKVIAVPNPVTVDDPFIMF